MRRVAYILESFPRLSETFIINEILEVENQGIEVKIFSRTKKEDGMLHPQGRILSERTRYLPNPESFGKRWIYLQHLYFLLFSPISYIKTFLFALKRRDKGTLWFLKMSVVYAKAIKEQKVDHIHSHFAAVASEYAMLISMMLNISYTFTSHGYYYIYENPPQDFRDRVEIAKKLVTVSEYNKTYLHDTLGIPLEKTEVIHCGVRPDFFISKVNQLNRENIILSVARLTEVKGLKYLIKACEILRKQKHSFRCLIVGDGEERSNLEKMIEDLDLGHCISLEGPKSHDEVKDYLKLARVFVQASLREAMGVAAMEALANGIPVIATKVYGVPELVEHGYNGFLVDPENPKAIAQHAAELLNSPELCQELGENGLRKIKTDFSIQKEVSKLIKIWFE